MKLQALLAGIAVTSSQAAIMSINFGTQEQTAATAAYTSTVLGVTATSWDYDGGPNGNDWSGNGTTFTESEVGTTIAIWHDAANTWRNVDQAESSVLHGYLDDGAAGQNYIHLTGLAQWLADAGDTEYRLTVLRSTDNAVAFSSIDVTTGAVAGETGWLGNGTPAGGATTTVGAIPPSPNLGAQGRYIYESEVYTGNSNGLAFHYVRSGSTRASVAGIIIESVPEPSSALLSGLGALFLLRRRR